MGNQTSLHVQLKLKLEIYKTVSGQPQNTLMKFTYLMNLDVHTITIKQEWSFTPIHLSLVKNSLIRNSLRWIWPTKTPVFISEFSTKFNFLIGILES
jgi:hypothetical protein